MIHIIFTFILTLPSILLADRLILQKVKSHIQQYDCPIKGKNNNYTIPLNNCNNYQYMSTIGIGTPPQNMTVLFDTGSNILWIPINSCNNCGNVLFNTSKSSTYQNTGMQNSIQYADGSGVSGNQGFDIVNFANTSINTTTNILWVNSEVNMNDLPSDGLVGLGFDLQVNNFFDSAYQAGQIATNTFALQLQLTNNQSAVYFNVIPSNIVENTYFVNQYMTGHWQVQLIGFLANDQDFTSSASNIAIIDSGTSLFYFNDNLFNSLINAFFNNCLQDQYGNILCPPDITYPVFEFMFVGIITKIYPKNYTDNVTNPGYCTLLFDTLGDVDNILLGDIFFRNYIITFDKGNQQIGFYGSLSTIYLIGEDFTRFFYIVQIFCVGFGGLILIIGIVIYCLVPNLKRSSGKNVSSSSRPANNFLLQMG